MNEQKSVRTTFIANMIWRFAERCGNQIIQFVVQVILARLLMPSDYGIISLITVFITIFLVFAQSGLGQALVQKKAADNVDFSTVFYFSLAFSVVLYGILYLCAPIIAAFYEQPVVTNVVRALGVTIIIGAVNTVQLAYVQKTMQFRKFFYSSLGGVVVSAVVGIAMAYLGFGVWALVGQQISNQFVNMVILWFTMKWRPQRVFSLKKGRSLFSFGWKILCSSLIDNIYSNIYSLTLGKFYSASDLGHYNRGKQFPQLIAQNINMTFESVLFPVLSEAQDEKERLKSMVRRSIVTSGFIIFPAMAGLGAVAEPLIKILLTDKWLPAVPFLQFCCFTYALWPIHTANLQAIRALGRSDIFLKLEIIKKILGVTILVITLKRGLNAIMIGSCVSAVITSFINASPNKKLLGYSYVEQLKDVLPEAAASIIMLAAVMAVRLLGLSEWPMIIIQTLLGICVYILLSKLFKLESLDYVINTIKTYRKK